MPIKINKQFRVIALQMIRPAVALTIAIVAVVLISAQMKTTASDIQEKRTAYATLEKRAETTEKIKSDFALVPTNAVEIMEGAFPPSDNISNFLLAMEVLASETSVDYIIGGFGTPTSFIKKGEGTSAVDISSVGFTLSLTGSAQNLINYFNKLDKLVFLTSITEIQITSSGSNGWESNASVSVRGVLYTKTIQ